MPYFHVPVNDLTVLNKDKSPKKLKKEAVLATIEDPKPEDVYVLFDNYDDAVEFAKHGEEEGSLDHFPIFEVALKNKKDIEKVDINESGEAVEEGEEAQYTAYETTPKNVIFLRATLKYVDDKFEDIILKAPSKSASKSKSKSLSGDADKDADKDEDNKDKDADNKDADKEKASSFSFMGLLKKLAIPTAVIGGVGAGFWFSGAMPMAIASLAKLGIVLPAVGTAAIVAQVALAAAVGAAAYGVGLLAWTIGKAVWGAISNTWTNWNKTKKELYSSDIDATTKEVQELEKQLGYDDKNDIVVKLNARLAKAPDPVFGEDGSLVADKQPKVLTKLEVLQKEATLLKDLAAANDDKRKELEADIAKNGIKISKP